MDTDKQAVLETIKNLKDIADNQYDGKINFAINKTVDEVKAFINCKGELPKELENTVTDITLDYLKANPYGIKQFETANIKSVERGDTTITYNDAKELTVAEIIENYKSKLLPYRKIKTM